MKYLKRLWELFDFKNLEWFEYKGDKIAKFIINENKYEIYFQKITDVAYHIFFYLIIDGELYFEIMNFDDNRAFRVFGNVKNAFDEFLEKNPNIEFIAFSTTEKERYDLYLKYAEYIKSYKNFNKIITKKYNKKLCFFIYDENKVESTILDFYINKFKEYDANKKKNNI